MLYSTNETISGQALVLPVSHFADSVEGFLYRVNPYMMKQCRTMSDFDDEFGSRSFGSNEYASISINGTRRGSEELGPIVVKMLDSGVDTGVVAMICERALNVNVEDYVGEIVLSTGTQYGNTSVCF